MLRLGIIIHDQNVPAWVNEIVKEISLNKSIYWSIVIRVVTQPSALESRHFTWFRKIDTALLPGKPNLSAKVKLDIPDQVPVIIMNPVRNGTGLTFNSADLKEVSKINPDLLLYFGDEYLSGEVLDIPKSGVWTLQHGDNNQLQLATPGFWEWFYQIPVSRASLLRLRNAPAANDYLANAITRTEYLSLGRNQTALFSIGIDLLANTVVQLANSERLPEPPNAIRLLDERANNKPDFWSSIHALWKLAYRVSIKFISKAIFTEQWVLFFSMSNLEFPQLNFQKFKALIPPKDRIWADPFVITKDGLHYVFIEELFRKTNKGHINCLVLNQEGKIEASRTIIDKPYHLSYPFIFQHEDVWYMIPESAESKTVDLFECTEFPFQWKFKRSLLTNVAAFDSTLHFHQGQFWLFCTIKKSVGASSDDNLYLFHTRDFLTGDWQPHPNNPIVSNPFYARPAGRIFFHDNTWYRPSQICVPRYGYGLSLNKITEWSESSYSEASVSTALPHWRNNLLSVHTLNFAENITIIDGQLRRFKI